MRKRDDEIKHLSEDEKKHNTEKFRKLFERMQRHEKKEDFKGEEKIKQTLQDPADIKDFKYLLIAIADEDLTVVVKDIVKVLELEQMKKEMEDKKTSKGVFGFFKSKPKQDDTIN